MLRPVMGFLIFEKFQTLCNALTNCIYESDCDKSELALSKHKNASMSFPIMSRFHRQKIKEGSSRAKGYTGKTSQVYLNTVA